MYIGLFWAFIVALLVACLSAFCLLLAYKLGIVELLQVEGNEFISKMAHCDFCMSWWLSVIISVIIIIASGDVMFLLTPFFATPIARRLI